MNNAKTYSEFKEQVKQGAHEAKERALSHRATLSEQQLNAPPRSGSWTVGQQFDHMMRPQKSYHESIRAKLASAEGPEPADLKHSFAGKLILKAFADERKVPVPKSFVPDNGPHDMSVIDRFIAMQDELVALLDETAGKNLCRMNLASPASALIRVNGADALLMLVLHNRYHLNQVEEALGKPS